ncbi:MAG: hypothetical protein II951_13235 [Bacteroidales bacterium]|nr:hypothetical protein [Bacteroidales bacterium]
MDPEKIRNIDRLIRRHMNGDTASLMRSRFVAYDKNYGLSLQHIRDLASMIPLSALDCDELFQSRWREKMILAVYALPAAGATPQRLADWATLIPCNELVDVAALALAHKVTDLPALTDILLSRRLTFDCAFAFALCARSADASQIEKSLLFAAFLESFSPADCHGLKLLCRSAIRLSLSDSLVSSVSDIAIRQGSTHSLILAEEIKTERDFLQG